MKYSVKVNLFWKRLFYLNLLKTSFIISVMTSQVPDLLSYSIWGVRPRAQGTLEITTVDWKKIYKMEGCSIKDFIQSIDLCPRFLPYPAYLLLQLILARLWPSSSLWFHPPASWVKSSSSRSNRAYTSSSGSGSPSSMYHSS